MRAAKKSYRYRIYEEIWSDIKGSNFPVLREWLLFTAIPFVLFNLFPIPDNFGELVDRFMTDWLSANIVKLAIAGFMGLAIVFWRHQYRAQETLYKEKDQEKQVVEEELESELAKSKVIPDKQQLIDAIRYIQDKTSFGLRKTIDEVFADIVKQAGDKTRLTISGRYQSRYSDKREPKPASSDHVAIAPEIIASSDFKHFGDYGDWSLVQRWPQEVGNYTTVEINYRPNVSMKQIKNIYDDRKSN